MLLKIHLMKMQILIKKNKNFQMKIKMKKLVIF